MVKKIISGGQTGADRAALDFAIKFDIPHGGWIVKGRMAEDGVLDDKYLLQEIPEPSYPRRTLKNVLESDGTLIASNGPLNGGSDYTRKMAISRGRPCLHIDLSLTSHFQAAETIRDWIAKENIEVMNVAGPRHSKDSSIYKAVMDILETAFFLEIIDSNMPGTAGSPQGPAASGYLPKTVEQAAEMFISDLSFAERTKIANLSEPRLSELVESIGDEIVARFSLGEHNPELTASCLKEGECEKDDANSAAAAIMKKVWWKLRRKRNILKVVKP